ncbi:MAG: BatD family protein [Elusimicrobiota bacterium]|nr:BatD family protein [Elusimicrobiota bacterium]
MQNVKLKIKTKRTILKFCIFNFKFLIFNICVYLGLQTLFAQNISIQSTVDKNSVGVGEQINFQVTVSGDISDVPTPILPPLNDFSVYQAGRSQSISIVNGRVSSSVTFNYALVPRRAGKFEIPSASINYKGQEYKTQPIQIEVSQQAQVPSQQPPTQKKVYQGTKRDIFVETVVDKKTAFVNEQITLAFRFYRRINLLSQPQYQPPQTTGFMTEDLPPQLNYYTVIDGVKYLVTEIRTALFPISSGLLTVGKATLECTIEDFSPPTDFFSDDFFKRFFHEGKRVLLQSEPINIQVTKLPEENKPKDFSGCVGNYKIKSSVDKSEVEVGQPITLNVTISGTGNIKTITQPEITGEGKIDNFRKYDTVSSFNIEKKNYVVSGSKTFKTVLIPTVPGKLFIPTIQFTYFDPNERCYKTTRTNPIPITVKQATVQTVQIPARPSSTETQILSQDIRHIKTKLTNFKRYSKPRHMLPDVVQTARAGHSGLWRGATPWFWIVQFLPVILFVSYWQYNNYREKLFNNVQLFRMTYAYKNATKKIKNLQKQIQIGSAIRVEGISSAIFDILTNYLADKLSRSAEGITIEEITNELTKRNVLPEKIIEIKTLWEEINFVQYAPAKVDTAKIKELVEKTTNIIKELEDLIS